MSPNKDSPFGKPIPDIFCAALTAFLESVVPFSSGVSVIASDWRYNGEIVNDKVGILYPPRDNDRLTEILIGLAKDPFILLRLKRSCLEEAKRYRPSEAIKVLVDKLV